MWGSSRTGSAGPSSMIWPRSSDKTGRPSRVGFRHPGQAIAVGFASAVVVGTLLLSSPMASSSGRRAPLEDALFTATSAVCVTGLVTVDTGTYWSGFGRAVILILIQGGGLGIMTLATLLAILLSRRLGVRAQLVVQAETKTLNAADIRRVIRNVVLFSLICELITAVILAIRFRLAYEETFGAAVYRGVFHAISAFNNAGFSTHPDSLIRYASDGWICLTITVAVIVGGLGFPVWFELARSWRRPKDWTVLTRITVLTTGALLSVGTILVVATEFRNPDTLGALPGGQRLLAAFVAAAMPRTAGFNSLDIAALEPETLFVMDILMFIGGGSASTAGGIKVTTFGLLGYVIWAELRGEPDVGVGRRRVPSANQRQALAVALLGIGLVVPVTFLMLALTPFSFDAVLFETVSAFATVGLSTGITADLPTSARMLLVLLMFVGRIGPLTVASAMTAREHARRYRLPEERTIVG